MRIRVRVQPRAKKTALAGRIGEEWKLLLAAPPVDGKANEACVKFFARGLRIARSRINLILGEKSRHKVLELEGVSEVEFARFAEVTSDK